MATPATTSTLRKFVAERFSTLARELDNVVETEIAARVSSQVESSRQTARQELADELNQAVRRLRQSQKMEEAAAVLTDSTAPFCDRAGVFAVTKAAIRGLRVRGLDDKEKVERFCALEIPVEEAAALAGAIQTRDPVVAMNTPGELSSDLIDLLEPGVDARAHVFPIVVRDGVVGLLYASGAVQMSALELLTQAAGACLETAAAAVSRSEAAAPQLVMIRKTAAEPAGDVHSAWAALSPQEQQLHLQAQRFARVQVAEMRLYKAAEVQTGRDHGDLYSALKDSIDRAREEFRRNFLAVSRTMVDYIHLELVRSLANNDATLLGKDYPGPLA